MANKLDWEFPEHEKLDKVKEKSQWLGEFIDWAQHEEGLHLCKWYVESEENHDFDRWQPSHIGIQRLLAMFLNIDLIKLEKEKMQMLDIAKAYQDMG